MTTIGRIKRWIVHGGVAVLVGLALVLSPDSGLAQGSWKVIAHPSLAAGELSREQVARLFLKKSVRLPGGRSATPIDLPERSAVREAFARDVLRKSPANLKAYWQQEIFAGRAVPPLVKTSEADVVRFVAENPSAIGYVGAGADVAGVKVVSVRP